MMADGQQVHRRPDFRIEDQVIAGKIFAQRIRRAGRDTAFWGWARLLPLVLRTDGPEEPHPRR